MLKTALNFVLKDQNGNDFELYKNLFKNVLLVFYPKDNSLVCSKQLQNYSGFYDKFNEADIKIAAINDGSPVEHALFCESKNLNLILLSDPDRQVIRAYGALYPFNVIKRKLVLISKDAEILFERNLPPYSYWNYKRIIEFLNEKQIVY